jgi:HEAT repeat protein/beta-lactamase regulating signal transducer with metallopeptidase domain
MTGLDLLALLGGTLAKGLLLLLLALGAARYLARGSAARRYAVWLAAFVGLLLLPVGSLVLPSLEPPQPTTPPAMPYGGDASAPAAAVPRTTTTSSRMAERQGVVMRADLNEVRTPEWRQAARRAAPWLLAVWLAGVLLALARLGWDMHRVRGLTQRAAQLRRGPLLEGATEVAAELGVWRPVRVAVSRELTVPIACGLLRPVIVLPAAARRWDSACQRAVLRHELAHVLRGDYAGHLLIELACAMHWPNPLAWIAARRARLDQERACDDRVLALGTGPVEYAEHLLEIARAFARPMPHPRGALAMAAAATLPARMRAILDAGLDHRPAGRRAVLTVACAAAAFGLPTAALHPWSEGPRERALVAALEMPDPAVRRNALWGLGARGAVGAESAIARRLRDEDPAARGVAAWALGKLGDRAAVHPLMAALTDPDAQVREMAVLALGDLGDPRAVPAIAAMAHDPEHGVRSVMTVALQRIRGEAAADALVRLVRTDADPHTRVMAAGALGKFNSRARRPALETALADADPDVRGKAAAALERTGERASVPALLAALEREADDDAADAMIHALGASADPRATDGLIAALGRREPRLRERAAQMLGQVGDERAVDPLVAATRDPDHEVRLTAVWALDALRAAH